MKVEFKIDDTLRTIEGTETEITRLLIALGKIEPLRMNSGITDAIQHYRQARDNGDAERLREARADLRSAIEKLELAERTLIGDGYTFVKPSHWIAPKNEALAKAEATLSENQFQIGELRGALRNSTERRQAAENKLHELGYEYQPQPGKLGWAWLPLRGEVVHMIDESAKLAEKTLLMLGWHYRKAFGHLPAAWEKRLDQPRDKYTRPPRGTFHKGIDYAALRMVRDAAVRTLEKFGFTYTPGAELWKPPLGERPYFAREEHVYDSSAWTGR